MDNNNNEDSDSYGTLTLKNKQVSTQLLSGIISNSILHNTTLTKTDAEKARVEYSKIIEHSDWKKLLIDMSIKIKNNLNLETTIGANNYTIKTQSKMYDLNSQVITLGGGRGYDCDVCINHHSCSRLHAVVFVQKNTVIVIDMGSKHGTITKIRSSGKEKQHSIPKSRKPLVFDRNERFVLRMGKENEGEKEEVVEVSFSPKLCIVCLDNPRQMLAECGHYILF